MNLSNKNIISCFIATMLLLSVIPVCVLSQDANHLQYCDMIKKNSAQFNLRYSMVLAMAKTESRLNSNAVSCKNARGIMQIVPSTAGIEAWKYVYGKDSLPPHDSVFDNPAENIKLGCAYIASLDKHYFRQIKDPVSKMYCLIAAYNTGASNVTKAFVTDDDISKKIPKSEYDMLSKYRKLKVKLEIMSEKINSTDSDIVKQSMMSNLPYQQTIDYLNKVIGHMETISTGNKL